MKKDEKYATVDAFMEALQHPLKAEIAAVRNIILRANNKMAERVKWSSPSFYYKDDFAAIHVGQQKFVHLILVFPRGLIEDESGLLEGNFKDRRMAYFYSMQDVANKKSTLQRVVNNWIMLMDQ
jgi:hypothetical protein